MVKKTPQNTQKHHWKTRMVPYADQEILVNSYKTASTREQPQNEIAIGSRNSKHLRDGSDFRGSLKSNSALLGLWRGSCGSLSWISSRQQRPPSPARAAAAAAAKSLQSCPTLSDPTDSSQSSACRSRAQSQGSYWHLEARTSHTQRTRVTWLQSRLLERIPSCVSTNHNMSNSFQKHRQEDIWSIKNVY